MATNVKPRWLPLSFIQVDRGFHCGPQVAALMRSLSLSQAEAFLLCCRLWDWAGGVKEIVDSRGRLRDEAAFQNIAIALGHPHPELLGQALIAAGLIKRVRYGIEFCGWEERYGNVPAKREKERLKKALLREKARNSRKRQGNLGLVSPGDIPGDIGGDSPSREGEGKRYEERKNKTSSSPPSSTPPNVVPFPVAAGEEEEEEDDLVLLVKHLGPKVAKMGGTSLDIVGAFRDFKVDPDLDTPVRTVEVFLGSAKLWKWRVEKRIQERLRLMATERRCEECGEAGGYLSESWGKLKCGRCIESKEAGA